MTRSFLAVALAAAALSSSPARADGKGKAAPASGPVLQGEDEKTLYALGVILGQKVTAFQLNPAELALVQRGMTDQVHGATLAVDMDTFGPKVNLFANARFEKVGKAYRDKAAKEPGAQVTSTGLVYRLLSAPTQGAQPGPTDQVKVDYEGKLTNGDVFDSSYKRNQPITFGLNQVIKCWTEGVQKMHVGEKAQLVCPSDIAYGEQGAPGGGIPPNSTLVFEVHLLSIEGK